MGFKSEEVEVGAYLKEPKFKWVQAMTHAKSFPLVGLEGRIGPCLEAHCCEAWGVCYLYP